jgi:hypothetical protein
MPIRIRIQHFTVIWIRIQLLFEVMGICDHWSIDPQGLQFEPPGLHCERLRLYFEPLKILNFDCNADPDPAFYSNADPDPASEIMRILPDPDPLHCIFV